MQVYIRTTRQCQPLTELQFKKIIADNYFGPHHFWFELDHAQTRGVMALFQPSPPAVIKPSLPGNFTLPHIVPRRELFPALPAKTGQLVAMPAAKLKVPGTKDHVNTDASELITELVQENNSASTQCNGGVVRDARLKRTPGTGFGDTDSKGTVSDWTDLAEDAVLNQGSGAKLNDTYQTSQEQQLSADALKKEEERVLLLLHKLAAESEHLKSSSCEERSKGPTHTCENAEDVQVLTLSDTNYENADNMEKLNSSDVNHVDAKVV